MAMQTSPSGKIDRHSVVPFHLKLFYRTGAHHRADEFPTAPHHALPSHLQIYTWPSCTLRELSHLLTTALPSLLPSPAVGTRLSFRLVFPDAHSPAPGRYLTKDLGSVVVSGADAAGKLPPADDDAATAAGLVGAGVDGPTMAGPLDGEPERSLQDARFVIGDYVSCAVFPPGPNGEVAPPPPPAPGPVPGGGQGRGGPRDGRRENGFGPPGMGGRGRGPPRGPSSFGRLNDGGLPSGEWRRGERLPEGPSGRGYGRPRDGRR